MAGKFNLNSIRARLLQPPTESNSGLPVAAVAVIINPNIEGTSFLLIRRSERANDPWSGQIAFPGGRKSSTDRSLQETAIRETEEEVGIRLNDHAFLGQLPIVTARTRRMRVLPTVFELTSPVSIRINAEVSEAFWVPSSELEKLEIQNREVRVEGGTLTVPSYEYNGRVIWGLTFRILNILLDRVTPDNV